MAGSCAQTTRPTPAPVRSEIDDRDLDGGGHRSGGDPGVVQLPPARSAIGEIVKEVLEESAQTAGENSAGDAGITHSMGRNGGVEHSEEVGMEAGDTSPVLAFESADKTSGTEAESPEIVREKPADKVADKTAVSDLENEASFLHENQRTKNDSPSRVFEGQNSVTSTESNGSRQIPLENVSNTPEIVRKKPADKVADKTAVSDLENEANIPADFDAEYLPDDAIENEVYRIELQFVTDEETRETSLKMRLRSRFSVDGTRPSFMLGTYPCGYLSKAQIEKARAKTLPPKIRAALMQGELEYELINRLLGRPGKGRSAAGRRAAGQNRTKANASVNPDKGSGKRSSARGGDDHQDAGLMDGDVSADGNVTVSNRIQ